MIIGIGLQDVFQITDTLITSNLSILRRGTVDLFFYYSFEETRGEIIYFVVSSTNSSRARIVSGVCFTPYSSV